MSLALPRPDVDHILRGLKDFQRQTVEYVFRRLYTDPDATRRFLIADEVGLGKTLVARGVIARALDHLWDKVDRLDVVYICSNADIARQNINRLNLAGQSDFALASRITLLPIQMQSLKEHRVNFVSFTPSTSFDLKSGMGMAEERILLYWLLRKAWRFTGAAPLNVLQGDMGSDRFRYRIHNFDQSSVDETLSERFVVQLTQYPDLRKRFDNLCDIYKRADSHIPFRFRQQRVAWIGEVRALLAASCLTALEPDLIILDEFQRFKHLLNDENEDSQLAQHLFNYSNENAAARVILLSATPYKMYTLAHEDSDDHYQDFVQTLKFLFNDTAQIGHLEQLIRDYRQEIFHLREGDVTALHGIKAELEYCLRRVMVRTERLAATADRDGMLAHIPSASLSLKSDDLYAYLGLTQIAENLDQPVPLDYWKSSPYLFNFMDGYDLKTKFKAALGNPGQLEALAETLRRFPQLLLPMKDIEGYRQLDPGNARLRSIFADTIDAGVWRALWLPPAIPYYVPAGPFANPALTGFTKRLVFSAWRVVPKAISVLLSYEAERQMFQAFDATAENTKEARERRRPLLRFAKSEGRLTGLPVLGLIYPCQTLALTPELDPLRLGADLSNNTLPTLETIIAEVEQRVTELLAKLHIVQATGGAEDERWYWATPLLLDAQALPKFTREWWQLGQDSHLADEWAGIDDKQTDDSDSEELNTNWTEHVQEAQNLLKKFFSGQLKLGRPPADLPRVLARMALAGLGVVALRALSRVTGNTMSPAERNAVTTSAAKVARSFLFLFNLPESTALIRSINRAEPYWQRVMEYSASGGLQAVMDEYVHVLRESQGLLDASPSLIAETLAEKISETLTYRTSTPTIDNIQPGSAIPITSYGMRGRFALRFGDEKNEDSTELTRSDRVRSAFNSPFWPFVLATTSVGQEGLDFHSYCHAVVHWNLPANPVDLEQREGRIHRYKGHAVRKNLARTYTLPGLVAEMNNESDVWTAIFQLARHQRANDANDLSPFWVYPLDGGAKIERHVPALPLSRDQLKLEALQRSLTVYRMVFGQNRQEDLLAYLVAHFSPEKLQILMEELRVDLSPPR